MTLHIKQPPVVIGGVGGSGTRLIAECVKQLGFFIGNDLNKANDNLWFTLLFKRTSILTTTESTFKSLVALLTEGMLGTKRFTTEQIQCLRQIASIERFSMSTDWLNQRANSLILENRIEKLDTRWGWKEPNSHIVVDRLNQHIKGLKYIHVMRNGLDMAYSHNQNQAHLWGRYFVSESSDITPQYSLKYWCAIHRRIFKIGELMGDRFLCINYDRFCMEPESEIKKLCNFLEVDVDSILCTDFLEMIRVPDSIGRFKQFGISMFDEADVEYVRDIGFERYL